MGQLIIILLSYTSVFTWAPDNTIWSSKLFLKNICGYLSFSLLNKVVAYAMNISAQYVNNLFKSSDNFYAHSYKDKFHWSHSSFDSWEYHTITDWMYKSVTFVTDSI